MRAFIAIELPATIKDSLSRIQDELKLSLPKISWIQPQNLHLTLKFLGNISPRQLAEIKHIITGISQDAAPFKIKLDELGVFPGLRQTRIIWTGISQDALIKQIAGTLETKLAVREIAKEKRDFSSHITIARVKTPLNPADLERELKKAKNDVLSANMEFDAGGITLFESVLGRTGAAYTVLEKANFKIT